MKRSLIAAAAVTGAALLAACGGGGGGGSSPVPPGATATPVPTATPKVTVTYALRWTGATHSSSTSSTLRAARSRAHVLDTTSATEPIELAVTHGMGSLIDGSGATSGVLQIVAVTSGGSPAPAVAPNSVSIGNAALADASPLPSPSVSPSPGMPLNVAAVDSSTSTGSTMLTANMPDGSTPSTSIDVYSAFTMECPGGIHPDAVQGYTVTGGALAASNFSGDVYFTAACGDTIVHFPYGYETFLESTPISTIAMTLPFVPAGTSVDVETLGAQVSQVANPIGGVIFGTASGAYVKLRFSEVGGSPQFVMAGAAGVCPAGICPL